MTDELTLDRCQDCCRRVQADDDATAFFLSRRCAECRRRKVERDAARVPYREPLDELAEMRARPLT